MKVLKAISALSLSKCVLGQYEGDPESEDPEARGMGLPSLSIFIQRTGYSVAQRTLHSMSIVEDRVVEMLGVT